MPDIVREADIVVVAVGKAESIGAEYFHRGQIVLDVGINWSEAKQKLVGDVDYVGSVTTAVLCKHVIEAAETAAEIA